MTPPPGKLAYLYVGTPDFDGDGYVGPGGERVPGSARE
jgi:hypothetical protein